MALRSPALFMGNPAVQHTAQNDRLSRSGLVMPEVGATAANRPLAGAAGVLIGPAGTMGEVTLLSNTQFTVNPARWLVNSSASALGGSYEVTNDAVSTLAVTAQNATQFRRSLWGVWVVDSFVAGSGDDLPHWGLVDGALAATAVAATVPSAGSLPANFLALGEFLIPPTGQAVTYTPYDVRVSGRGAILPVSATDTRLPAFDGQYRRHPTLGLQEGLAGGWSNSLGAGSWVDFPVVGAPYFDHYPNPALQGGGATGAPKVQMRIEPGRRVACRGMAIAATAAGSGGIYTSAATIPVAFRPPYAITFVIPVITSGGGLGVARLELDANGILYVGSSIAANTYFPMNYMSWELS